MLYNDLAWHTGSQYRAAAAAAPTIKQEKGKIIFVNIFIICGSCITIGLHFYFLFCSFGAYVQDVLHSFFLELNSCCKLLHTFYAILVLRMCVYNGSLIIHLTKN